MIKALKNTFTFDLYKNNQIRFHRWLSITRSQILGSFWTYLIGIITAIAILISVIGYLHNSKEISEYEYRSLIQDEDSYAEQYPEWKAMLEDAMSDGYVSEGENTDLRRYLLARWDEKALMKKLKTRAELTKILK